MENDERSRIWKMINRAIFEPSPWPWIRLLVTAIVAAGIWWLLHGAAWPA